MIGIKWIAKAGWISSADSHTGTLDCEKKLRQTCCRRAVIDVCTRENIGSGFYPSRRLNGVIVEAEGTHRNASKKIGPVD